MLRGVAAIVTVSLFTTLASDAQEPYSALRKAGPTTLAITFRSSPDRRAALREHMLKTGLAQLEGYKARRAC